MDSKKKNVLIIILIAVIFVLIGLIGYFVVNNKLDSNNSNNSTSSTTTTTTTTTTTNNQNIKIKYHFEKTRNIANCVDIENDTYECKDVFKDGVKLEYPVIDETTEVIKSINKKIFTNVNNNIESIENYPNVINNIKDANCIALKIINNNKLIDFEHLTIEKYIVMPSENYLSIINIEDMMSNCASGGYFLKDVIIYDNNNDKILTQDEIKNRISNSLFNELKNIYSEEEIYLFYNKNGNISSIGYLKDSNNLLQIYELVKNKWNLFAEGVDIFE